MDVPGHRGLGDEFNLVAEGVGQKYLVVSGLFLIPIKWGGREPSCSRELYQLAIPSFTMLP